MIDDDAIVDRRDDRPKVARKRKVAQRGCDVKNDWGNAKMCVSRNDCPLKTLTRDNRKLCEHAGPCKPGRGCGCYDTGTYCDRNCGCPPDCEPSRSPATPSLLNESSGRL